MIGSNKTGYNNAIQQSRWPFRAIHLRTFPHCYVNHLGRFFNDDLGADFDTLLSIYHVDGTLYAGKDLRLIGIVLCWRLGDGIRPQIENDHFF